jgi:hypothetical protein
MMSLGFLFLAQFRYRIITITIIAIVQLRHTNHVSSQRRLKGLATKKGTSEKKKEKNIKEKLKCR